MPAQALPIRKLLLFAATAAVVLVGALYIQQRLTRPRVIASPATRPAATAPTHPVTLATRPVGPQTYIELIRRNHPDYPATQPFSRPLPLPYAGHFKFALPVYLDAQGYVWITASDADDAPLALSLTDRPTVCIVRQRPVFVHWMQTPKGWLPALVCLNARGDGYELRTATARLPVGTGLAYDWARAFSDGQRIVVPTSVGVSLFVIKPRAISEYPSPPLADSPDGHSPVQIAFLNGPIAWIPPTKDHPGSAGAVRCIETAWFRLGEADGWPSGIIHIIPMPDGSVMQLLAKGESTRRTVVTLDAISPEEKDKIQRLIITLSDADPAERKRAYEDLTRYGPGLWPIAEAMLNGESPEVQSALKKLLRAKSEPMLGGMQLVDDRLRLLSRHPAGGALFYAKRGVVVPRGDEDTETIAPAWLSVQPGEPVRLLPREIVRDLDPDKQQLVPSGQGWVVSDDVLGVRTAHPSGAKLTAEDEREYLRFIGRDRDGRYYLRKRDDDGSTLIIDPTLPSPVPRLPVWELAYVDGSVGWDRGNWPAARQKGAWSLHAGSWKPLDEKKEPFFAALAPASATTLPANLIAAAAKLPEGLGSQRPLLVDRDGNAWFDGRQSLTILRRDGSIIAWPLPAVAAGEAGCDVNLVQSNEGYLFLFNQPGRVLRLRFTPEDPQPLKIDATFAKGIPNTAHPARIWLDPAGRICIAYENRLAILFPSGFIPSEMMNLIPASEQEE